MVDGDKVRGLSPDERTIAAEMKRACATAAAAGPPSTTSGVCLRPLETSLRQVLSRLGLHPATGTAPANDGDDAEGKNSGAQEGVVPGAGAAQQGAPLPPILLQLRENGAPWSEIERRLLQPEAVMGGVDGLCRGGQDIGGSSSSAGDLAAVAAPLDSGRGGGAGGVLTTAAAAAARRRDIVVVVGDDRGFTEDDEAVLGACGAASVCLGRNYLLASHCAVIVHHLLDGTHVCAPRSRQWSERIEARAICEESVLPCGQCGRDFVVGGGAYSKSQLKKGKARTCRECREGHDAQLSRLAARRGQGVDSGGGGGGGGGGKKRGGGDGGDGGDGGGGGGSGGSGGSGNGVGVAE